MIYFTSDWHLGHHNIIKYCNRPFNNVDEMDSVIIDNVNSIALPQDTIYHHGDFAFTKNKNISSLDYRKRIRCKNIHIIKGNHDNIKDLQQGSFSSISNLLEIKYKGISITMCHYAMRVWNKSHHGSLHSYGHSHGQLPSLPNSRCMDVGVDPLNFQLISIEEFIDKMMAIQIKRIDNAITN